MHGDLSMSLTLNPFLLILLIQSIVLAAAFTAAPTRSFDFLRRHNLPLILANVAIAFSIWAVRLSSGAIPAPF